LTGWRLVYRNASNSNPAVPAYDDVEAGVLDGINMNPQSYAVVGNGFHVNWYQQPPLLTYGSFALRDSMGSIVDSMSFGGSQVDPDNAFTEGAPAPQQTGSHARIPNGFDSNNNSSDFQQRSQTWGNPNPP